MRGDKLRHPPSSNCSPAPSEVQAGDDQEVATDGEIYERPLCPSLPASGILIGSPSFSLASATQVSLHDETCRPEPPSNEDEISPDWPAI